MKWSSENTLNNFSYNIELQYAIHTFIPFRINPHIVIIRLGKTTENLCHDQLWFNGLYQLRKNV